MMPEQRTLLKVTIEDLVKGGGDFQHAYGRPGRAEKRIIEKHALEVRNLDI